MRDPAQRLPLLIIASILVVTDIGIVLSFGLTPFVMVFPLVVLAIVLAGPKPRVAPWRDGFLILCLLSIFARSFAPRDWPREMRWALGVPAASGIGLLFIAYAHADGVGAWLRRLTQTPFSRGFRTGMDPRSPQNDRISWRSPEWLIPVGLAVLLIAVDLVLQWTLRLRPWTLVPPLIALGFTLAGPRPGLAPWRDAVLLLCASSPFP